MSVPIPEVRDGEMRSPMKEETVSSCECFVSVILMARCRCSGDLCEINGHLSIY